MISIILPVTKNNKYVQRCISSAEGNPSVEILLCCNDENITYTQSNVRCICNPSQTVEEVCNAALGLSEGEGILFAKEDLVFSNNFFQNQQINADINIINSHILKDDTFLESPYSIFSIYGKVFSTKLLKEYNIEFSGFEQNNQLKFLSDCLQKAHSSLLLKDVQIYDENIISTMFNENSICMQIMEFISKNQEYCKKYLDIFSIEKLGISTWNPILQLKFVNTILPCCMSHAWIIYFTASKYIKPTFDVYLSKDNKEEYHQLLKIYFEKISDLPYKNIILPMFNLNEELLKLFLYTDFNEYSALTSEMKLGCNLLKPDNELQQMYDLLLQIKNMQNDLKNTLKNQNFPTPVTSDPEMKLEGEYLAEYVVTNYRAGHLGFRTIIESVKAWMGCKFHK